MVVLSYSLVKGFQNCCTRMVILNRPLVFPKLQVGAEHMFWNGKVCTLGLHNVIHNIKVCLRMQAPHANNKNPPCKKTKLKPRDVFVTSVPLVKNICLKLQDVFVSLKMCLVSPKCLLKIHNQHFKTMFPDFQNLFAGFCGCIENHNFILGQP